jgi:hypothetical protein
MQRDTKLMRSSAASMLEVHSFGSTRRPVLAHWVMMVMTMILIQAMHGDCMSRL